jgi:hypothetical protein
MSVKFTPAQSLDTRQRYKSEKHGRAFRISFEPFGSEYLEENKPEKINIKRPIQAISLQCSGHVVLSRRKSTTYGRRQSELNSAIAGLFGVIVTHFTPKRI